MTPPKWIRSVGVFLDRQFMICFRPRAYERRVNGLRKAAWRMDCMVAALDGRPPPCPPSHIVVR